MRLKPTAALSPSTNYLVCSNSSVMGTNGVAAQSVEQVRKTLGAKPKSVALLIQRGEDTIFVPVKLS